MEANGSWPVDARFYFSAYRTERARGILGAHPSRSLIELYSERTSLSLRR